MQIKSIAKLIAFTAVLTAPMFGQAHKEKIVVVCACDDQVGSQYATALRDAIARSPRYELADESINRDKPKAWVLHIVSLDMDQNKGVSSAISVTLTFGYIYGSNWIQTCGITKVSSCAETALSGADGDIQNILAK